MNKSVASNWRIVCAVLKGALPVDYDNDDDYDDDDDDDGCKWICFQHQRVDFLSNVDQYLSLLVTTYYSWNRAYQTTRCAIHCSLSNCIFLFIGKDAEEPRNRSCWVLVGRQE